VLHPPDLTATEEEQEQAEKIYADLVSIYPDNESYLRRYAEALLASGKLSTATLVLRKLHSLLEKKSPDKASALVQEFPQIGRIGNGETEQPDGDTELGEMLCKAFGALWIKLHQKRIKEGHHLYRQGEQGDTMALLIDGEIAVFRREENGESVLLNLIAPNDIIGEACFLNPGARNADIVANKDSIIVEIPRKKLVSYFVENPGAEKLLEEKADFRQMTALLSANKLLQDIPLKMRKYMATTARTERYKPNMLIRQAGQRVDAVDMLVWGKASYMIRNRNNEYVTLGALQAGELIGDTSALRKTTCPADIVAVSDVLMAHIPLSSFTNVVEAYPPFKEKLFKHAQQQRTAIMQMVSRLGESAKNQDSD
jgi:CRP-like cAMP-binding protein